MSHIATCAKCGESPIVEFRRFHEDDGKTGRHFTGYVVHCVHCSGTKPHPTEAEAVEEWNKRQAEAVGAKPDLTIS